MTENPTQNSTEPEHVNIAALHSSCMEASQNANSNTTTEQMGNTAATCVVTEKENVSSPCSSTKLNTQEQPETCNRPNDFTTLTANNNNQSYFWAFCKPGRQHPPPRTINKLLSQVPCFGLEDGQQPEQCSHKPCDANIHIELEKVSDQLMKENARLCDELKDAKIELRHCMERVEGPVCRQIQKEKCKSKELEQELVRASRTIINKEYCFMESMCDLRNKLECTNNKVCELAAVNRDLKQQISALECKYSKVQDYLVNQKLKEAEAIKQLTEDMGRDCGCDRQSPTMELEHPSFA